MAVQNSTDVDFYINYYYKEREGNFMGTKNIKLLAALVMSAAAFSMSNAHAQVVSGCEVPNGNFGLSLNIIGAGCSSVSANTAQAFLDKITTSGLQSLGGIASTYNGTQVAQINANFNSLMMSIAFPVANGAQLNLSIPGLNVNQTFNGATRDASQQMLADYLKKSNIIGQIMQYQAANSPTSPIAGAGGVLPNAVSSDFNQNFTNTATHIATPSSAASAASQDKVTPNLIGAALSYSSLTSSLAGFDSKTTVTTLPLSYTIRNNIDPRRQLIISMPITQIDTNGAKSYQGSLGAAYHLPMNDNWTLTPGGKVSAVGSVDMATVAGLYSFSLTSTYIWNFEDYDVSMGNMLGYNATMKLKSGDYAFDPGIKETILRNGVMLSQPVNWGGKKLSLEYSAIDTRYMGTKLYINNTQEVGITVGTNKSAFSSRSFLRGGLTYMQGKGSKGFTANIGYWF